jgi:hypothetical protein
MEIAGPSGRDGQDAVVLVNCADGGELEIVREALTRLPHTPAVLVSRSDMASVPISLDLSTGLLDIDGCVVRPAVVWLRHSSAGAITAQAHPAGSMSLLGATAWSWLLGQLAVSAVVALPGSAPAAPGQLTDAARLGVRTPRTVFTTDAAAARKRVGSPQTMIKVPDFRLFEPDRGKWTGCLPEIVDDDSAAADTGRADTGKADADRASCPVIVQEYLAHARELRVYYLNGGICAFEVHMPAPSAVWVDPAAVTVTRADCPAVAAELVRTLCTAWSLRYGAFDLLVTAAGEPVFLEVNPDGDWLWYERKAGWHGVSFMATAMVHELFVRITSAT